MALLRANCGIGLSLALCSTNASWHALAQSTPQGIPTTEQVEQAPRPPEVQPPRLIGDVTLRYPLEAIAAKYFESVTVDAILVIDAFGVVDSVTIAEPIGNGFDQAAREAAIGLRFEPALRNGVATKSRIRFRFLFAPPVPVLAINVTDDSNGAPLEGAQIAVFRDRQLVSTAVTDPHGNVVLETVQAGPVRVVVSSHGYDMQEEALTLALAERTEVGFRLGKTPLTAAAESSKSGEAMQRPLEVTIEGMRPEPTVKRLTRSDIRQIPGAFGDPFRAVEILPGVTPIMTGLPYFYLRGAPPGNVGYFVDDVHVPYLFHLLIGPSVVHPGFIDQVELHSDANPARLGRYVGGVVVAATEAMAVEPHGEAQLRLFDVGAKGGSGFDGGKGAIALAGRYSYTGALLSALVPEVRLDYRDYQIRASYALTPRDRVAIFGFGAYDYLSSKDGGVEQVLFGTEFYRAKLSYEHRLPDGTLALSVTPGFDRTLMQSLGRSQSYSVVVRSDLEHRINAQARMRAGMDFHAEAYRLRMSQYLDPANPEQATFRAQYPSRLDSVVAAYVETLWRPLDGLELSPGLRIDVFRVGGSNALGIDPRLRASYRVSESIQLVQAVGVVHQPPAYAIPIPGMAPADMAGSLQTVAKVSTGVDWLLARNSLVQGTAFYSEMFHLSDGLGTNSGTRPDEPATSRASGTSLGLELYFKHHTSKRVNGSASYTLSRSTRRVGGERFVSAFDRTHVLHVALSLDAGRSWRIGARGTLYTGTPKANAASSGAEPAPRTIETARNDPFFRLDLRLEKRWNYGDRRYLSFVVELMNATLSKELLGREELGPVTIPSIGLEGGL